MDNKQRACYPCHREFDSTPLSDIQLQFHGPECDHHLGWAQGMVQSLARVSGMGFYMLQDHATGPPNKIFLQLLDPSISETVEQAPCLLRCYIENIHF